MLLVLEGREAVWLSLRDATTILVEGTNYFMVAFITGPIEWFVTVSRVAFVTVCHRRLKMAQISPH